MCGKVLMGETVVLDHLQFSKYSTAVPVVSGIGLSNASCCSRGKGWTNVWVNVPPADSIYTEDSVAISFVHMIWVGLQKSMVISGQVMGYCPPAVGCL